MPIFWAMLSGKRKNGGRGDACEVGFVFGRCWRMAGEAMLEGSGGLVELFGGVVGGGDLVVASCLVQNNDSKRKTAI